MIRHMLGCLLAIALLAASRAAADDPIPDQTEPPVRLKKKVKPSQEKPTTEPKPAAQKKPDDSTKAPSEPRRPAEAKQEPDSKELEDKLKELMNRISQNMNRVEERLGKKDPGETTQQTQRDIVRDLDDLIDQTKRQQQQQQQNPSSASSPMRGGGKRLQKNQSAGKPAAQNQANQRQDQRGNNAQGGNAKREGSSKVADLYKDVWGHLPETLRQEMDQYSREQFMAKYNDLLKQYYATIAEKGRRKSEQKP